MHLKNTNIKILLFGLVIFSIDFIEYAKNFDLESSVESLFTVDIRYQEKYWEKTYGGPKVEIGWSVQLTGDGGYIIGGFTDSYGAGERDSYLVKTDSKGNKEWQRPFGGKKHDSSTNVQYIDDGGYILCGATSSFGAGDSDLYIVKTDSKGLLEWEKNFGGVKQERGGCIKQTGDQGFIVCGETSSFGAGESDIYLVKINSKGEKQWDKTYGGPHRDWGNNVQLTSDGGYIIGGNTASYGQGKLDVYLIKTDKNGNKRWEKTFGGTEDEYIHGTAGLIQTKDGGFIFCAVTESYGEGMSDFYIVKTNHSGEQEWQKTFGGSKEEDPLSILQIKDGGYLICGYTKSIGAGDRDVYLIKIDNSGKKEWEKTYGGPDFDCGIAIQQTIDGRLIICGETKSYGAGDKDVYLIKTDSRGNFK